MTQHSNGTELAVIEAPPPAIASVFGTDDTDEIMVRAGRVAHAVERLVQSQGFASSIQGRQHVNVEGWNGLGSILGLGVRVDFVRPFTDSQGNGGYEAAVSIVTRDGAIVGGAQSICTRGERTWRTRDDYAIYSMAQTRATGKAYRSSLSWLMKMAGFEATPAEELPHDPTPTPAPAPAVERTVDDVAADIGVEVSTLREWWTRNGAPWDAQVLAKMKPAQVARAAASVAEWRADLLEAEAAATLDATAEPEDAVVVAVADEPKASRRRGAAKVDQFAEDTADDFDLPPAQPAIGGYAPAQDDDSIPFGAAW